MERTKILIIDDEPAIRFAICDFLEKHGYQVEEADSCAAAETAFVPTPPDAVICDFALPDGDALTLLPRLRTIDPSVPVIILTGHGSIDLAVRAIKEGAEQFLTKPVELPALLVIVQRLLENQRNRQRQLADAMRQVRTAVDPFLGTSAAMLELAADARRVLSSESPILIQGETGTGKGVLAQWLHNNGPRASKAFVDINCAGLSREFLETELFGHEKGAFTGANTPKLGLLEVAHRGTAFLDELGDMDLQVQAKLLKVLEEKRFRRLGSTSDRHVDVRLVSATHQDLGRFVAEHTFRSDLFFRISTIPLTVPPLRERIEDLPVLAEHLLARIAIDLGRHIELTADAQAALAAHTWPGNIRELRNVLERAVLLNRSDVLTAENLRFEAVGSMAPANESGLTLMDVERRHIARALAEENGQVARAAKRLGIPKSSLYQKIKKYGIELAR